MEKAAPLDSEVCSVKGIRHRISKPHLHAVPNWEEEEVARLAAETPSLATCGVS